MSVDGKAKAVWKSLALLVGSWSLAVAAYCRCGPPGPFAFLPLFLDYALLGAMGVVVGSLALAYLGEVRGALRLVIILLASVGIAVGLFFASSWLPMFVFYGD